MKTKLNTFVSIAFALALAAVAASATAQIASTNAGNSGGGTAKTDRSIEYHGGPVLTGSRDVYFIAYGCWGMPGCTSSLLGRYNDFATLQVLTDFMSSVGTTPYMQINSTYTDAAGQPASSSLIYGGMVFDYSYSHGVSLTEADIQAIVADQLGDGGGGPLPQDPQGIFVVLTSDDIAVVDGATQFCLTCCNLHGRALINGAPVSYIFVGNPSRCPNGCATQFAGKPSPNDNYAADAMASWLAHALNEVLTDPYDDAWYDRYGLENAEKCEGTYGTTYTVTNASGAPAQANIKLGVRDYLLQQNWVNGKKGHCGLNPF